MNVVGMDHVQLTIPAGSEVAARGFYSGVLGLTEIPKPPELAGRGGCWFERGRVQIHLGIEPSFAPARKAHPAFLVEDLEAARRALEDAGARVEPDESVPGVRRLYTEDPFGNRIELIRSGDGFSERSGPWT